MNDTNTRAGTNRTDSSGLTLSEQTTIDASGSYLLEYAYQGVESPSDSMEPDSDPREHLLKYADRLAAQIREDRPESYRRKHAQQVTS